MWCDPHSKEERQIFTGSPFTIHVTAGKPTAEQSYVDGWTKDSQSQEQMKKHTQQVMVDTKRVVAGDTVSLRPYLVDMYGNQATLGEGEQEALTAKIGRPDGSETQPLTVPQQVLASGATKCELRTEATMRGEHLVHLLLHGVPISGSPISFDVVPSNPETAHSMLIAPDEDPIMTHANLEDPIVVKLITYDRFGNECNRGGLLVTGRLALDKNSTSTDPLMPNNHSVHVEDCSDGTYAIKVAIKMTATVKLSVQMDKNLGAAGELPPLTLNFVDTDKVTPQQPASLMLDLPS